MPLNGMNVGTDYTFLYYDGMTGALVQMGDIQNIRIAAQKHDIKTMPYNDFTITRNVSTLEDLMVTFANNFQNGTLIRPGYLNESINNWDGTISRYQYVNFVTFLTDHGDISREKIVTIKFEGMASKKIQIA